MTYAPSFLMCRLFISLCNGVSCAAVAAGVDSVQILQSDRKSDQTGLPQSCPKRQKEWVEKDMAAHSGSLSLSFSPSSQCCSLRQSKWTGWRIVGFRLQWQVRVCALLPNVQRSYSTVQCKRYRHTEINSNDH